VEKQKSTAAPSPKTKPTPTNFAEELEQKQQEIKENSVKVQQQELQKE
jgi:hypothetical protein